MKEITDLYRKVEMLEKSISILAETTSATRYMNAREAAKYIGISERLFNSHLSEGTWTNIRIGRRRVFRPCDIDKDLDATKELSIYQQELESKSD